MIDIKQLYEENENFRLYVDKYCEKHTVSIEEALTHKIVIDYREYLTNSTFKQI